MGIFLEVCSVQTSWDSDCLQIINLSYKNWCIFAQPVKNLGDFGKWKIQGYFIVSPEKLNLCLNIIMRSTLNKYDTLHFFLNQKNYYY